MSINSRSFRQKIIFFLLLLLSFFALFFCAFLGGVCLLLLLLLVFFVFVVVFFFLGGGGGYSVFFSLFLCMTFCLLAVFMFVMRLFISAYCDVPLLDFVFNNNIKTIDWFSFLKDTDTHLCNQTNMIDLIHFESRK